MQQLLILLILLILLSTAGCNWRLHSIAEIPPQMKQIIFDSWNINDPLNLAIRNQLRFNNIAFIEKDSPHQNIPLFRVLNSSLSKDIISVFQDKWTAEYQIVLSVSATVLIPDKNVYPINTKVYRLFFNDPKTALAKVAEQQLIINEMYNKAAEQLIRQLISIQLISKSSIERFSEPLTVPNISAVSDK